MIEWPTGTYCVKCDTFHDKIVPLGECAKMNENTNERKLKIKCRIYDPTRDLLLWTEWIDFNSLEFAGVKNWTDVREVMVVEQMTRQEFLEKFK